MLVYGRDGLSQLYLLYAGLTDPQFNRLNLIHYTSKLLDSLQSLKEVAATNSVSMNERKKTNDRNCSNRHLEVGSLVMCRVPGLQASLSEAWAGPFEVLNKFSSVSYRIRRFESMGKGKVVHLNSLKQYTEHEANINKLTIVAEEPELPVCLTIEDAPNSPRKELQDLLSTYNHVLSEVPGHTKIVKKSI